MVTLFSAYAAERGEDNGGYMIGHITIGDDYDKKLPGPPPLPEGRNPWSTTGPAKRGKGPTVTFDWQLRDHKFLSLSEGDKYHDPGADEREGRVKQAAKQRAIHDKPFRNPGPSKKSVGLGNYYGCFNEVNLEDGCKGIRHETEYDVIKKGELPAKQAPRPANIKTCPTRKGTYGMPGMLLSDMHLAGNAAEIEPWTGLEYICDPYDREQRLNQEKAQRDRKHLAALQSMPWKSQQRINPQFFDS